MADSTYNKTTDSTYKVVVGAKLNGVTAYFDLDTCVARSLTSSATVTSFPIENGLSASDHMYRNPRTFTLSGTFSLNRGGHRIVDSYTMDAIQSWHPEGGTLSWEEWLQGEGAALKSLNAENYLQSVQTVFEYIQEKGILCQIMMAKDTKESSARFKVRNNMVLQNIQWQEMYNSMTYSFTFQEVISVIKEQEFETFGYNDLYPSVYLPATKSIGELVTETGMIWQIVLRALITNDYVVLSDAKAYSLYCGNTTELGKEISKIIAENQKNRKVGMGLMAGGVAVAAVGGLAIGLFATGVGAAIGAAIVVGIIAYSMFASGNSLYGNSDKTIKARKNGFTLIKNASQFVDPNTLDVINSRIPVSSENTGDVRRLKLLLNAVQANIIGTMNNVNLYQISTGESDNKERECPIQIGNDLLTIRINKTNNPDTPFNLTLFRLESGDTKSEIAPYTGGWPAYGSFYTFSRNANVIYVDRTNQYEMYLYNPYLEDDVRQAKGYTEEYVKNNLCNYYFVVSKGNINDNMKKLTEAIDSALVSEGYGE